MQDFTSEIERDVLINRFAKDISEENSKEVNTAIFLYNIIKDIESSEDLEGNLNILSVVRKENKVQVKLEDAILDSRLNYNITYTANPDSTVTVKLVDFPNWKQTFTLEKLVTLKELPLEFKNNYYTDEIEWGGGEDNNDLLFLDFDLSYCLLNILKAKAPVSHSFWSEDEEGFLLSVIYFINNEAKSNDADIDLGDIQIEESLNESEKSDFVIEGDVLVRYKGSIWLDTEIIIPNGVTSIGDAAFEGYGRIKSIKIPNSVTTIGNYAFHNCSSLTNIEIPDSVTSIGSYAFLDCSDLENITIPNSVTSIGDEAFWGCSSLTSITIPDSVISMGSGVFKACSNLKNIVIPNNVTNIGAYAFLGCRSLTDIIIPNSVKTIGDKAFRYCDNLTIHTDNMRIISDLLEDDRSNVNIVTITTREDVDIDISDISVEESLNNLSNNSETIDEKIERHETLNSKLWDEDNNLKPAVKEKVDEIVDEFLKMLDEDNIKYKLDDVIICGSSASYNYTDKSDIDLHLRFDLDIYNDEEKKELVTKLYDYSKKFWNERYDISIYGIPLEIYIETDYDKGDDSEESSSDVIGEKEDERFN